MAGVGFLLSPLFGSLGIEMEHFEGRLYLHVTSSVRGLGGGSAKLHAQVEAAGCLPSPCGQRDKAEAGDHMCPSVLPLHGFILKKGWVEWVYWSKRCDQQMLGAIP